jgi:hypothetical protein
VTALVFIERTLSLIVYRPTARNPSGQPTQSGHSVSANLGSAN